MIYTRFRSLLRHQISRNVLGLSWVQLATFVVPLVTLPYVSRVLGPAQFGLVVFSQGFSIFLTLFVDWGFTPYGVRRVATDRDDPDALTRTVALVRSAQLLMAGMSIPVALGVLFVVPRFNQHPAFLAMAWVAAVSMGLMPVWFFVGLERLRPFVTVQLVFRVIGAALTFALVRRPGDAWIVMALFMASSLCMWAVSDALVYSRVSFRLAGIRKAAAAIRDAGRLFIGTVALSLLSTFNVVLLGLYVSSAQVAQFGASERIIRTCEQVLGPVGTAVYPRLTFLQASGRSERARRLAIIGIGAMGGAGVLLAAALGLFAPLWIHIVFGRKFVHEGAPIMRILALLIPSNILGSFAAMWLMTLHRDRTLLRIALVAAAFNVTLGSILSVLMGPQGMAWSVLAAQVAGSAAALVVVYRIRGEGGFFARPGSAGVPPRRYSNPPAAAPAEPVDAEAPVGLDPRAWLTGSS